MRTKYLFLFLFIVYRLVASSQGIKDDGKITVRLLQLNDVYEISGLDKGNTGGMARVATVRKKLVRENANTFTLLAGDFLSPSVTGTLKIDGQAVSGKQMVETMNASGIDLVTFGNHEFDIKEAQLQSRLNESNFNWVSSNVIHKTDGNNPFVLIKNHIEYPIPATRILAFSDTDGTELRIGIFALTINSNHANYVGYEGYSGAAQQAINELKGHCDFIMALTHLSIDSDKQVALRFPEIKMIIGGHEHVHSYDTVGSTIIAKADANARTVYVHELRYDKNENKLSVRSILTAIDNTIPEDGVTKMIVTKWERITDSVLRNQGFDPAQVIMKTDIPYDGRESKVRFQSTNLTRLIAKSFSAAAPGTDCSMYNSGSIRLDDELKDEITQYDIIRTLPYEGKILEAVMKGFLLKKVLDIGQQFPGNGCFLQYNKIEKNKKNQWMINGKLLQENKVYHVAVNDYLVSGQQENMEFLKSGAEGLVSLNGPQPDNKLQQDYRAAVIHYIQLGGR